MKCSDSALLRHVTVGAAIGSVVWGMWTDKYGRKVVFRAMMLGDCDALACCVAFVCVVSWPRCNSVCSVWRLWIAKRFRANLACAGVDDVWRW